MRIVQQKVDQFDDRRVDDYGVGWLEHVGCGAGPG
jgi:hypothetical protein